MKRKMKRKTVCSKPKHAMSLIGVTGIFFKPLDFAQVSQLFIKSWSAVALSGYFLNTKTQGFASRVNFISIRMVFRVK